MATSTTSPETIQTHSWKAAQDPRSLQCTCEKRSEGNAEGRGRRGSVMPTLPEAVQHLRSMPTQSNGKGRQMLLGSVAMTGNFIM